MLRATLRRVFDNLPPGRTGVLLGRVILGGLPRLVSFPDRGTRITPIRTGTNGHVIACEWVRASFVTASDRAILYFHGGGYVACSTRTHRGIASRLSARTDMPVLMPAYRLAPEHPFPAAFDDAVASYRWLLDRGIGADKVIVAGDSAGGHLAIVLAAACERLALPAPAGLVLFSPLIDPTLELATAYARAPLDPFCGPAAAKRALALYVGTAGHDDPRLAPLRCGLGNFPPVLLQVGDLEMLSAEAEVFARHVERHGGVCTLDVWPGQAHVFQALFRLLPEGRDALDDAARFIRSVVAADRELRRATPA